MTEYGGFQKNISKKDQTAIPFIVGYVGGQNTLVEGSKATLFAVVFTAGLFITIAAIGVICSLLGRMLGDVGSCWTIAVGLILLWVALDMSRGCWPTARGSRVEGWYGEWRGR